MFARFTAPLYFIVTLSILGLSPTLVKASAGKNIPASDFLRLCKVTAKDRNAEKSFARCENLIQKTRTALQKHAVKGQKACIPQSVKKFSPVVRVIGWLESHPEKREPSAGKAVAQALAQSWPCK